MTKLSLSDCSIRISTDHIMLADPRGFSQLTASFVGSWCQGILPTLLLAWPVWIMFSSFRLLIVVNYPTSKKFLLSLSHNFLICITFTSIIQFSSFCFNYLLDSSQLSLSDSLSRRISYCVSNFDDFVIKRNSSIISAAQADMMGTSGLEPPTSRLSGVRSNHLSYAPVKNAEHFLLPRFLLRAQCARFCFAKP